MAERQRTYPYDRVTLVEAHDTNVTIKGARYIQVTTAGNVVFNHRDGTQSQPIPLALNQSFTLGYQHVGIHTDSTADGFLVYWDADVPGVSLS